MHCESATRPNLCPLYLPCLHLLFENGREMPIGAEIRSSRSNRGESVRRKSDQRIRETEHIGESTEKQILRVDSVRARSK